MSGVFGRYIIADPRICHGQLTFRGTRILVSEVLEQVASGIAWEAVTASWGGKISKAAIAEAVPTWTSHRRKWRSFRDGS